VDRGGLFRGRSRSAKRLARRINEAARQREAAAQESQRDAYRRLLGVACTSLRQARRLRKVLVESAASRALRHKLSHGAGLVKRVLGQTRRRMLAGEAVPVDGNPVSLFEPHTWIVRCGKSDKPTEFGCKVWLSDVEGGIISDYRILEANPEEEESQVVPSVETPRRLFGRTAASGRRSGGAFRDQRSGGARARSQMSSLAEAGSPERRAPALRAATLVPVSAKV
jgi:IS5 family transposase